MSVAMHLDRRDVFSRATVAVRVLDQHRQDSFERARGPEEPRRLKTNGASPAAAQRPSFAREAREPMGTDSLRPSGTLALHDESFLAFPPIRTWPGEGGNSHGHRAFFSAPDRRKERKLHHRDTETQSYSLGFSRYLLEVRKESPCPCVYHVNGSGRSLKTVENRHFLPMGVRPARLLANSVVKLSRTAMQNQHRVMRVPVMTRTTPVLWGHA